MYLAGFALATGLASTRGLNALDQKAQQLYSWGQWRGADPVACERQGGIVSVRYESRYESGVGVGSGYMVETAVFSCSLPQPAPAPVQSAAPVINTAVQTTVSPQISPALIQQQEPSNSPVTAGTAQTSPAPQSSYVAPQPAPVPAYASAPAYGDVAPPVSYSIPGEETIDAGTGQIAPAQNWAQTTPWLVFAAAVVGLVAALARSEK